MMACIRPRHECIQVPVYVAASSGWDEIRRVSGQSLAEGVATQEFSSCSRDRENKEISVPQINPMLTGSVLCEACETREVRDDVSSINIPG